MSKSNILVASWLLPPYSSGSAIILQDLFKFAPIDRLVGVHSAAADAALYVALYGSRFAVQVSRS